MENKRIPLGDWAKAHNVVWHNAINWAKRGKLPSAVQTKKTIEIWEVSCEELPPKT